MRKGSCKFRDNLPGPQSEFKPWALQWGLFSRAKKKNKEEKVCVGASKFYLLSSRVCDLCAYTFPWRRCEAGEQPCGANSLQLPLRKFRGWNSGCQTFTASTFSSWALSPAESKFSIQLGRRLTTRLIYLKGCVEQGPPWTSLLGHDLDHWRFSITHSTILCVYTYICYYILYCLYYICMHWLQ